MQSTDRTPRCHLDYRAARLPLLRLRKASTQFFGLNCVGQEQFDKCFDQWYAQVPDKLVGP